ncbi:MAG TPA: DUF4148 domain-containing protein [Burkholderiaceae bacterium]|nr:DUF4148 domain-containing protein [Burkholderiaceae bacterium]
MKRTLIFAALLAASSAPALASELNSFDLEPIKVHSTKSRAEVQAELKAAQAAGQISFGEAGMPFDAGQSIRTRAQVVAETHEAARLGLLNPNGEAGSAYASAAQEEQIRVAGLRALETGSVEH